MKTTWNKIVLGIVVSLVAITFACNESTTIGSELILEENIDLGYTDTLTIKAKTVLSGPIPTYFNLNFNNSNYMLGELDDPIFGKAKSSIYLDAQISGFIPSFAGGTLDSMVFILGYNINGFYGDSTATHDIEVYRLDERLDLMDTIYSNETFEVFGSVIRSPAATKVGFVPNPRDSITLTSYTTGEEVDLIPQIRMRLNDRLAQTIFADTVSHQSNEMLLDLIKGFVVTSTTSNGNSMIGLDLSENTQTSGLEVYYTNANGAKSVYRFVFFERRHQNFEVNPSGADIENYLNTEISDGGPLFIQGMSGAVTEFDLSSIHNLGDKLLNVAKLEVFVDQEFPENNAGMYPPPRFLGLTKASNGESIGDLTFAQQNGLLDILFGGDLQDSTNVQSYEMILTSYLKDVQDGREDGVLHLELLDPVQSPRRSVLYGPGHPQYAPKLKITFTTP